MAGGTATWIMGSSRALDEPTCMIGAFTASPSFVAVPVLFRTVDKPRIAEIAAVELLGTNVLGACGAALALRAKKEECACC